MYLRNNKKYSLSLERKSSFIYTIISNPCYFKYCREKCIVILENLQKIYSKNIELNNIKDH